MNLHTVQFGLMPYFQRKIVNNKFPGDVPGNILLVSIEGVEARDVSIDVIHLVFSAFCSVHKIATFEKTVGFQALIQFSDAETASLARNALDKRSIPRYLLPEHVGSCHFCISYSGHKDLNIKFQSNHSSCVVMASVTTATAAIETLEGHSTHDGGYCQLHLTYSRHIDLNVKLILIEQNCLAIQFSLRKSATH
ncbi:hypothetical protein VNO77_35315 [Canavalia gladiata]|uniref:RRM domain-containing protein n=1 Tax=Canavalia gladiata TaxID=3824 RepID=A0AAN9KF74_CANGL